MGLLISHCVGIGTLPVVTRVSCSRVSLKVINMVGANVPFSACKAIEGIRPACQVLTKEHKKA